MDYKLKMPNDYTFARRTNHDKGIMHGMKSPDCHIFTECLLLIIFRSLTKFLLSVIVEISLFFKDLCCITLNMGDLVPMAENIPITQCKLERLFSLDFFYSMKHLVIHHPMKAIHSSLQYRWMYLFQR